MINSDNQKFSEIRFDWEREEILEILNYPLIDLMWEAQIIHRRFNQYKVQLASLFSVLKLADVKRIVLIVVNQFIALVK